MSTVTVYAHIASLNINVPLNVFSYPTAGAADLVSALNAGGTASVTLTATVANGLLSASVTFNDSNNLPLQHLAANTYTESYGPVATALFNKDFSGGTVTTTATLGASYV